MGHPQATQIGLACFDYVLSRSPWEMVHTIEFRGDVFRQTVIMATHTLTENCVLTDIPTYAIAKAWAGHSISNSLGRLKLTTTEQKGHSYEF